MNQQNEIILFENQKVKLEVNMQDETVWLSVEQMAKLFDRDRTVITRHINNIFKEKDQSLEILSMLIKKVWNELGKITGETENEDIISMIFSKFCVGK